MLNYFKSYQTFEFNLPVFQHVNNKYICIQVHRIKTIKNKKRLRRMKIL